MGGAAKGITKTLNPKNAINNFTGFYKKPSLKSFNTMETGGMTDVIADQPGIIGQLGKFGNLEISDPSASVDGSGYFKLDPEQAARDSAAITGLGDTQYQDILKEIDKNTSAQQKLAADTFQQMLPGLAEDYNAGHLLNSTGYQSEASRQAYSLANQVAAQAAAQRLGAFGSKQGFQTSALQRGLGLEDFQNQATLAKSLGSTNLPQQGGKNGLIGGGMQGASAGSSFGPWGALIGGVGGAFMGSRTKEDQKQMGAGK